MTTLQLANNAAYLLQHVSSILAKQSDQVLQEQLGIGLAQFKILQTLKAEPRTPQREIAFNLGQTEASISRQVKLMTAAGMLQSMRSPKDHREHLTVLAPKGERLVEAAQAAMAKFYQPIYGVLGDKQQAQLASALESLHAQVCQAAHPEPSASSAAN